jgi:hypothetical protein
VERRTNDEDALGVLIIDDLGLDDVVVTGLVFGPGRLTLL